MSNITKKEIREDIKGVLAANVGWRENGPRVNDLLLDMLNKLDEDK